MPGKSARNTTNRSLTPYWESLPVELPQCRPENWKHSEELAQVAWLIFLSTYEDTVHPTCYFRRGLEDAVTEVVSLPLDSSSSLESQAARISKRPLVVDEEHDACETIIIWGQGPGSGLSGCKAQEIVGPARHKFKMALVLEDFNPLNDSPFASRACGSSQLLLDRDKYKSQEDGVGRVETLKTILSVLVKSPANILAETSFLSAHDRSRIVAWNIPLPSAPLEMTIPSGFADRAREHPDAPAIYAWDGEMTYRELDIVSSGIASLLALAPKSGPHNMVLFNMRKSKWALIAALALLKCGRTVVPTDPDWPEARLNQIRNITGATLAVCDQSTKGLFDVQLVHEFLVPPASDYTPTLGYCLPPEIACRPNDLAYVLFSSGSTGIPKGMLREHGTACTASFAHAEACYLDRTSRVLQFANHVFDVAMLDFFTALILGACVCIPSEIERKNDLAGFMQRSQANWALLTPTVAEILDPSKLESFRFVTLGGESIQASTLRKWLKACRVGINYGSAEVDIIYARDVVDEKDSANVGKRLPTCSAYVVHRDNPALILPIGAVGELVVAGPTMAREYLKNPLKTAEVFLDRPERWIAEGIASIDDPKWMSRIYRMGDLFRQRWDGSIEFISRKDFQVKVNGQKVELGDIESKLLQHQMVKQCAVLYPGQGPYAKRLVAIIQTAGPSTYLSSRHTRAATALKPALSFEDMREFLSRVLPPFMLPSVLIAVNNMPYTPTMKINRICLKDWLLSDDMNLASQGEIAHISTTLEGPMLSPEEAQAMKLSELVADVVAPRNSKAWASIYGHENLLSDIGIDSAQAMRLAFIIQKHFGVKPPVAMLGAKTMTIRKLAELVTELNTMANTKGTSLAADERLECRVAETSRSVLCKLHGATITAHNGNGSPAQHVLLTGATGYFGVQILMHLLRSPNILSVTVIVRGAEPEKALLRVQHAMKTAEFTCDYEKKLRVWSGDLSKPHLGLSEQIWKRLSGSIPPPQDGCPAIDSIIHCGAVVDWTKSYDDLDPANVVSTEQLLKLTLTSDQIQHFVFISGGRYPDPLHGNEHNIAVACSEAARGSGYAQTKFVAEQVVNNVRQAAPNKSIHVARPAYLIGSTKHGIANQDDYLWRIVWAAVRVKSFNKYENDEWLFVADASQVAGRVVDLVLHNPTQHQTTIGLEAFDGLIVEEFWTIVGTVLGVALAPVSAESWLQMVRQDMDGNKDHKLWPLADTLGTSHGQLTNRKCPAAEVVNKFRSSTVAAAVERNVQRLSTEGFFN